MSNKTQLQTNNTTLDSYIARINAAKETAASLPEAGSGDSGGGASVETCTVTINNYSGECFSGIIATVIEGGQEVPYISVAPGQVNLPVTISNIKCGTPIVIIYDIGWAGISIADFIPYTEVDCGAAFISATALNGYGDYVYVFTAPTIANSNSTIIAEVEA